MPNDFIDNDFIDYVAEYATRARLQKAFVTKYQGHKHFMFAWSLATARWGDCHKDFRRGKITKPEAAAIIRDAIEHQLIPQESAEFEYAEFLS